MPRRSAKPRYQASADPPVHVRENGLEVEFPEPDAKRLGMVPPRGPL